ncbi:acetylcholine receptor subunit alpha-type acr-16 isoform X17 [Drosophila obscura]|uniref:acetylcholine receptor subunit alpha-type acr-16 isoform X17 n=1 Tax=Drosophila obscura TaxID=7282 RepID=UPI001BB2648D|nr:acetylcholine receptor subunit alpha-type acr-16 isoform X17 [Drosophila obscura]
MWNGMTTICDGTRRNMAGSRICESHPTNYGSPTCSCTIAMPGKKNTIVYACCPEPYVDITFTIQIRRRTLYYFFNLIVPCVLISSMALLGFTLPPDSGEKLTLGVTILLSLTVFLNLVAETLPQVSDAIPLLGTYFNCIMFMVASSVVLTVVVLNYHHRTADIHEMPPWIKSVFLQWLPWILRMGRPGRKITRKTILLSNRMKELELKERSSKSLLANVLDIDDDFRHTISGSQTAIGSSASFGRPTTVEEHHTAIGCNHKDLHLILKELQFITARMRKADDEAELISDWKFAAMVVDSADKYFEYICTRCLSDVSYRQHYVVIDVCSSSVRYNIAYHKKRKTKSKYEK